MWLPGLSIQLAIAAVAAHIDEEGKEMDKYSQLEKLSELKDKGVLSDEEFIREKAKILGESAIGGEIYQEVSGKTGADNAIATAQTGNREDANLPDDSVVASGDDAGSPAEADIQGPKVAANEKGKSFRTIEAY